MNQKDLRQLPVSQIVLHWELNRAKDEEHVHVLASHINENGFDNEKPVKVVLWEGQYHLAAGHHRLEAAMIDMQILYPNLPLTVVPAEVLHGDLDTLILTIQMDNFQHDPAVNSAVGLALNRDQKRQQCKVLLTFPDNFKRSDYDLAKKWGVPRSTLQAWREDVSSQLGQIDVKSAPSRGLKVEEYLSHFYNLTVKRYETLIELIRSGEREVTRARADGKEETYTQKSTASADKKDKAVEDERATAIVEFEKQKALLARKVEAFTDEHETLTIAYVRRRLFYSFGLNLADNAAKWTVEAIRKETIGRKRLVEVFDMQSAETRPDWICELDWINQLRSAYLALRKRVGLTQRGREFQERIQVTATADFEAKKQPERLELLRSLLAEYKDVELQEDKAVQEKVASQASEKLILARRGAVKACENLVETFMSSRVEKRDEVEYKNFLLAAVAEGRYSSSDLTVTHFLGPNRLDEENAHRVRSIADKMRLQLALPKPPVWMLQFFPAPAPAQEPPAPAQEPPIPAQEPPAPAQEPPAPAQEPSPETWVKDVDISEKKQERLFAIRAHVDGIKKHLLYQDDYSKSRIVAEMEDVIRKNTSAAGVDLEIALAHSLMVRLLGGKKK